jgi:hypothetical protein
MAPQRQNGRAEHGGVCQWHSQACRVGHRQESKEGHWLTWQSTAKPEAQRMAQHGNARERIARNETLANAR